MISIQVSMSYRRYVSWQARRYSSQHAVALVQRKPKYPAITDLSPEGILRTAREKFYDSVKILPSVEQKMHAITSNRRVEFLKEKYKFRFHGLQTYTLSSCAPSYAGIPFQRFITRTNLIHGLPQVLQDIQIEEDYVSLKQHMCSSVANYYSNQWRKSKNFELDEFLHEQDSGGQLANDLLAVCCKALAWKASYLIDASYDPKPDISSYWWHGGFDPINNPEYDKSKEDQVNGRNLCFQFNNNPYYTVRINKLLSPIVPMADPLCSIAEVEKYQYPPEAFNIPYKNHYLTCLPGFWPGASCQFPFLQVYTSEKMDELKSRLDNYNLENIEDGFGVMASFGWLNGLAVYQGFTPFHDLTYPIVGQTILTNGQDWKFFVYQLNTIAFHEDVDKKDKRNLCWSSPKMRLFDTIEDGEVKALNEEVFHTLIKFLLHSPMTENLHQLTPYLGIDNRTPEQFMQTRKELIDMYKNQPTIADHKLEVPMWIRIYKEHPDAPPSPYIRLK